MKYQKKAHLMKRRRKSPRPCGCKGNGGGMGKYRKKPVVIEAVQWTGENLDEVKDFLGKDFVGLAPDLGGESSVLVRTPEGHHGFDHAPMGWWIIRGVKGEHYGCRDDIFRATYEPVVPPQVPA